MHQLFLYDFERQNFTSVKMLYPQDLLYSYTNIQHMLDIIFYMDYYRKKERYEQRDYTYQMVPSTIKKRTSEKNTQAKKNKKQKNVQDDESVILTSKEYKSTCRLKKKQNKKRIKSGWRIVKKEQKIRKKIEVEILCQYKKEM